MNTGTDMLAKEEYVSITDVSTLMKHAFGHITLAFLLLLWQLRVIE